MGDILYIKPITMPATMPTHPARKTLLNHSHMSWSRYFIKSLFIALFRPRAHYTTLGLVLQPITNVVLD